MTPPAQPPRDAAHESDYPSPEPTMTPTPSELLADAISDRDAAIRCSDKLQLRLDETASVLLTREEELAEARKHIEELAYAAGSWHRAHMAGQAMGAASVALTDRERRIVTRALRKLREFCQDSEGPEDLPGIIACALDLDLDAKG